MSAEPLELVTAKLDRYAPDDGYRGGAEGPPECSTTKMTDEKAR